jgi:hypothetical protein
MKRGQEPITISDWILYLGQIPDKSRNMALGLATLFIAVISIASANIIASSNGIEGVFSVGSINRVNNNTSNITFAFGRIINPIQIEVNVVVLVIITILALFVLRPFNDRTKLRNFAAEKLIESILFSKYPRLKNVNNIEKCWTCLKKEIQDMKSKEVRKLISKKRKELFDIWFDNIVELNCIKIKTRLIFDYD